MCDIQGEFGLKDGRGILVVFGFFFLSVLITPSFLNNKTI